MRTGGLPAIKRAMALRAILDQPQAVPARDLGEGRQSAGWP